jgi:hypothetical protein
MSASPAATAVTSPRSTLATSASDDCHVASEVTGRLVPSGSAAVAANCADAPRAGAVPVTITAVALSELGAEGEPPHATARIATVAVNTKRTTDFIELLQPWETGTEDIRKRGTLPAESA